MAADPTKIATPAGLVAIGGVAAIGFFSRQAASLTKWAGSKTAGPLVRFIGGFFKSK